MERSLRTREPDRLRRVRGPGCLRARGRGRHVPAVRDRQRIRGLRPPPVERARVLPGAARRSPRRPGVAGPQALPPERRARDGVRDPRLRERASVAAPGADRHGRRRGRVVRRRRLHQVRAHGRVRRGAHAARAPRRREPVHERRPELPRRGEVRPAVAAEDDRRGPGRRVLPGRDRERRPRLQLRPRRVAAPRGRRRDEGPCEHVPRAPAGLPRRAPRDRHPAVDRRPDGGGVRALLPDLRGHRSGVRGPLPARRRGRVRAGGHEPHHEPHHRPERVLPRRADVARRHGARRRRAAPGPARRDRAPHGPARHRSRDVSRRRGALGPRVPESSRTSSTTRSTCTTCRASRTSS